jgi:hypothetical protein
LGFEKFTSQKPFDPSLYVHFRKRISEDILAEVNEEIVKVQLEVKRKEVSRRVKCEAKKGSSGKGKNSVEDNDNTGDAGSGGNSGKLIIDSTCAPADIAYPTDIRLVNEGREKCERIIDTLWGHMSAQQHTTYGKKPRTYRKKARKEYLAVAKSKRVSHKRLRKVLKKQLQYIRRDLDHIETMKNTVSLSVLSRKQYKDLLVIHEMYRQQYEMYLCTRNSISDRIVSISQPHVRPIVRGKAERKTEFGAKISASVADGYVSLDRISWDAYNEGSDLKMQALRYKERYGCFPKSIHADKIYRTRENLRWCKKNNIRFSGPPLGRPPKECEANKEELTRRRRLVRADELDRIEIEGRFGQSKRRYSLNRVMTKLRNTSECAISLVFLVMNLEKALEALLFCLHNAMSYRLYRLVFSLMACISAHISSFYGDRRDMPVAA